MNKKIILAGGTGLLGSSLSNYLSGRGYEPIILTREKETRSELLKHLYWDPNYPISP